MCDYLKYLGVPYTFNGTSLEEGFDCITLCNAIAKDRGIPMMNVNHINTNINTYHYLFNLKDDKTLWENVLPQGNVLVVFKVAGKISHVGYMLDKLNFIHILENSKVTVEKITNPTWNKRIVGFYKYIGE